MKRLASNKDITILRTDKGIGTVVLNRDDYIKKLFDIISGTYKFKKLSTDPRLLREGHLQHCLRNLKNNIFMQKKFMINLSCVLSYLLSEPITTISLSSLLICLILSFLDLIGQKEVTFCEEIKKISASNRFLISYDMYSLFTSIPFKETFDIAVNLLYEHNLSLNISKAELKKKNFLNLQYQVNIFFFKVHFTTK